MTKESIPNILLKVLTEEEITMFQELQLKIKELNFLKSLEKKLGILKLLRTIGIVVRFWPLIMGWNKCKVIGYAE